MIICSLTLLFEIGVVSAYRLQRANMEFIFNQSTELLSSYMHRTDYVIDDADNLLYRIVTSNEIQKSGSRLLKDSEGNLPSAYTRQIEITNILEQVRQIVNANKAIVSVTYVDEQGNDRNIALTSYISIPNETIKEINLAAQQANGDTIYMDISEVSDSPYTMIMARSIREKHNLSMKHMGTIILCIDVEYMFKSASENGTMLLSSNDYAINYLLNNTYDLTAADIPQLENDSYDIVTIKGKTYFMVKPNDSNEVFNYCLVTPYMTMFSYVSNSFLIFIIVYFCFLILTIIFGVHFSNRITKDIRSITAHISSISQKNVANVEAFDTSDLTDHDAIVMAESFNTMSSHINELIEDNYKNEILIKETRLRELQAQINPHFLYNTLNSLYWMAKARKNEAASQMVSSLGILLREAISNEQIVVTVSKELDVLSHYFTIQKNRYENRLEFSIKVCPDVENFIIPKFSLQPVVENAITYGLENMLDTCLIEIRICANDDNTLVCKIMNNGPAPEENLMEKLYSGEIKPKGHGIGLKNIDLRIKAIFGDQYGVSISREDDKTVVMLTMECMTMNAFDMRKTNE